MPSEQEFKVALQIFQSQRLRRDHADLAEEDQYYALGNFVFEELYGPHDFSERDTQAKRLNQFIRLIPGLAVRDVEQVFDLLSITNVLDDQVADELMRMDAPIEFDEETYECAYREADNYDDRVLQLELVRGALYNVYRMARKPLLHTMLKRTHTMAHAAGMSDIHQFLFSGYEAILPVKDIHRFVETVHLREYERLNRIYGVD